MSKHEAQLAARTFRRHAERFTELGLHEEAKVMRQKASEADAEAIEAQAS